MQQTTKFGLPLPAADDYYDINHYRTAMQRLDSGAVKGTGVGNLRAITQEAFADLDPDASTLYIVTGSSDFTLYLGDKPLQSTGGVMAAAESVISAGASGIIGYEEVSV